MTFSKLRFSWAGGWGVFPFINFQIGVHKTALAARIELKLEPRSHSGILKLTPATEFWNNKSYYKREASPAPNPRGRQAPTKGSWPREEDWKAHNRLYA
jgi:hypothetical protein